MSRNVRRLLLDYQPLWFWLGLVITALVILVDWGWLFRARDQQVVQWVVPIFCVFAGATFVPKLPAWQVLPVPSADRRRAQWWVWIGLPLLRAVVSMAVPLAILPLLHGLHAAPRAIAGVLEAQLLAIVIIGVIFSSAGALRRRFGLGAGFAVIIPMLLIGAAASALDLADPVLLAGAGIAVLALVAGTYAGADRIGAAGARFGEKREPAAAPAAVAETAGSARGWAALLPYALRTAILVAAATVAINYILFLIIGSDVAHTVRRNLPSQMLMTIIILSGIGGTAAPYAVRALRALPVGPAALAAMMHGFLLTVLLVALGAMWAMLRAAGLNASQMHFFVFGAIPMVALRLPAHFRLGMQLGAFVSVLPIILLVFLRFQPWSDSIWFMLMALLLTVAIWLWTWWELAHGRAAYRPPPTGVSRWRGGLN